MRALIQKIWPVLDSKEKKRFSIGIALDSFISLLDILFLVFLLWVIGYYIRSGDQTFPIIMQWLPAKDSIAPIAIFLPLFAIKNIAAYFITRSQFRFISRVAVRISKNNLISYQQSSFGEYVNVDSSVHIRKIAFQPFEFCQYLLAGIQQVITQTCLVIVAIAAILAFNARLFLLLLLVLLPPVLMAAYIVRKKLGSVKDQIRSGNERSFQYLLDALKGYVEGNIYGRNAFFLDRFTRQRKIFSSQLFESLSLQSLPSRLIELFAVTGLFLIILLLQWNGNAVNEGWIILGAFMAAAYKIIPGVVKLINITGQMRAYEQAGIDLIKPFRSQDEPIISQVPVRCVELKEISFHYPGHPVLDKFSLQLKQGDLVGICGKSGVGKTTLVQIMLALCKPDSGEIHINGNAMGQDEVKKYWSRMAYVKQQPFLINDTILKNITLNEEEFNQERLRNALEVSGLDDYLTTLPEGLEKVITENGKNISGGQQQRIAMARAFYQDADLLLLDEPFNELDEASEFNIIRHLKAMSEKGKIVLLVTHNNRSLAHCHKIISLDDR